MTIATPPRCGSLRPGAGLLLFALIYLECGYQATAGETSGKRTVRDTIRRSLPYIEREGASWIAKQDCLSCHHTSFLVWSLGAARRKGIPVEEGKLEEWIAWATDWHHLVNGKARADAGRDKTLRAHGDTLAQLLLGRPDLDRAASSQPWVAEYAAELAGAQQADGSWNPGGQLPSQKRPKRETQEVSTAWALLALGTSDLGDDRLGAQLARARSWFGATTSGRSTEWWATRLLLERRLGDPAEADRLRTELLRRQRADGGWGWLCEEESDALGTGIALFALGRDGLPRADPAVASARRFLQEAQADDGSWAVRGTKESARNRVERTSTFWGTCWAVIGLCETLDEWGAQ